MMDNEMKLRQGEIAKSGDAVAEPTNVVAASSAHPSATRDLNPEAEALSLSPELLSRTHASSSARRVTVIGVSHADEAGERGKSFFFHSEEWEGMVGEKWNGKRYTIEQSR